VTVWNNHALPDRSEDEKTFHCDEVRRSLADFDPAAEFDKQTLVARLQAGKRRARAAVGNPGGMVSHAIANPEVVAEAKRLRRRNPRTGKVRSFRKIAEELAQLGHFNAKGQPFAAQSVKNMIDGPRPQG
jgi:hypothetical protein